MRAFAMLICILGAAVCTAVLFIPGTVFFALCAIALPLDQCAEYLKSIKDIK